MGELFEIVFPFNGQELFFFGVARLAARHNISLGAFPAAGNRDDMIHGEFFGRRRALAVMALPFCHPAFPPLGPSELPGFAAFAF